MKEKLASALMVAAAEFINRESNRRSLVTVTRVDLGERGRAATVFVSVMPQEQTHAVMDFLSRQEGEFKQYLRNNMRIRSIPRVVFMADPMMGLPPETDVAPSTVE